MPFTLSHPAAVLPLLRHPFSPAALVCGSLAPDMPYFLGTAGIPVSAQSWYEPLLNATTSHQVSGIGLPAVFGALLLTAYALVRRPMAALLPTGLSLADGHGHGHGRGVGRVVWVLLSLVTGIVTHLVWDSFTHADGYLVTHLGVLRSDLVGDLTVARALQHLSTAVGLLAVALFLWHRLRGASTGRGVGRDTLSRNTRRASAAVLSAAVLAGAAVNTASFSDYRGGPGPADRNGTRDVTEAVLSDWVTGGGAALACAVLAYAGGWWAHRALRRAIARRSALAE
ncbi:DUF4184 family protein [Streptomyces sp. OP7]|uniref:DUF4184 family protein n=1 Tax=Streptomyces sp. OP7 TaxID=3142462 RepID=UPI0032E8E384